MMERKPENKEQNILLAAEQEFMEKGFAGAKTLEIARKAGVTHAMLHYYFRTKQNLFERILADKVQLIGSSVVSAFSNNDHANLTDRIISGALAHFDFLTQNPLLPRFIINEVDNEQLLSAFSEKLQLFAQPIINDLQQQIDAKVDAGEYRHISVINLLLDIASFNVFPFLVSPLLNSIGPNVYHLSPAMIFAQRREELKAIIKARLLINNHE